MRVTTENGASSLVIFQAAFSDEGVFKCTATNRAGHVITKSKLRLEGTSAAFIIGYNDTTWKRKVPKYGYHKNRNRKRKLLPKKVKRSTDARHP